MKSICLLVFGLVMTTCFTSLKLVAQNGVSVAGGNGIGLASNQLGYPESVFVDVYGNVYVADVIFYRIQKWEPGATKGVTVAGGNGQGSAANQFYGPSGLFVDVNGNVFAVDGSNQRVQKWAPGATQGITAAGGNGQGPGANQLNNAHQVFVDPAGNIYVTDVNNNRVQKWAPGATQGVTVAGGNGAGSAANQLSSPSWVFVDVSGNIYVSDRDNFRIQKWAPGATEGVTVLRLNNSTPSSSIFIDASENIFVSVMETDQIIKFQPGSTVGKVIAGGNGRGPAANQFLRPEGIFVDRTGNLFVADQGNARVQKFGSTNGLSYRYYEGFFSTLPDFNSLTPVKIGITPNIGLGMRRTGVNDSFAVVWEGYINIPAAGNYTFETVSDDGSKLYFNSFYSPGAVPLIDNDGTHPAQSVSGTVNVPAPGNYPITITYFENFGGEGLQLFWSGPGMPRQRIPDEVFTPAAVADNTAPDIPANLHVVSKGGNFFNLDWKNSNDNVLTTAYDVYIGGVKKYSTSQTQITIDSLSPNTPYSFTIKARDLAGNSSGFSNTINETTTGVINGLNYKYYEGEWSSIPNFSSLTPVKTGSSLNVDIEVRPSTRKDNFAFVWEGYINIETPGDYIFETISDDGSMFYFNSLYSPSATPTINNDGIHSTTPVKKTITIPGAGSYPIAITYFEKVEGQNMEIYWSGPGFPRQLIPNKAFTPSAIIAQPSQLTYRYYEGIWNTLPNFSTLTPVRTGNSKNVDISVRPENRNDNFAFVWEGKIKMPSAGTYTFETSSDDGSRLYFNSLYSATAVPTVDNDGVHAPWPVSGSVNIPAAGSYPIAITYFEKDGGESMKVYWSGPGIDRQLIPDAAFDSSAVNPGDDITPPTAPENLHVVYTSRGFVHLDWDNSTDNVGVTGYNVYVYNPSTAGSKLYNCLGSAITIDSLSPNTSYTFIVKAKDLAGNVSSESETITAATAFSANGLKYRYYEGTWSALPDFNTLIFNKTGSSANADISVRNAGVNDLFGFVWEGYINITTPGYYTFETISDDGSRLYFNSLYNSSAVPTVENDGEHYFSPATGTVYVPTAGLYPISFTYFDKYGGQQIQLFWTGPNFARQVIPNSAFVETVPPTNGLTYRYYEGTWNSLPNFSALTPVKTGVSDYADISARTPERNDNFGFVWEGYIRITTPGTYTFEIISDDGSKLYFNSLYNSLATATVNNDGIHAPWPATGTVNIPAAGIYPISITFFEKDGGETMQVYWTGPGIQRQIIPNNVFLQAPPTIAGPNEMISDNQLRATADELSGTNMLFKRLYPNPFNESFTIDFYNSPAGNNKVSVGIYELSGRLVYMYQAGRLPAGNNVLKIDLTKAGISNGVYMAKLMVNGITSKTIKLVKARK